MEVPPTATLDLRPGTPAPPAVWSARVTEAQLKVLLAVADTGGFSLASQRLSMSQPGVSRAVASLEEELGVQLLTRRRGAVSLTTVGVNIAMHARSVLAHSEAIRQEAGVGPGVALEVEVGVGTCSGVRRPRRRVGGGRPCGRPGG